MPSVVTFSNGNTITYTYASDGRKLRMAHKIGSTTTTTDYAGNVIYENGVQKKLLTEEGYVDISVSTPVYYYYLKDHQGNNRVVVNSGGTVTETNHYYPFGGTFASGTVQPYKYNGKELDTKAGLNWYDYGARHYDAALGRFTTQDPLAKDYYATSPYGYCLNNPVKYIDPDGKDVVISINGNNITIKANIILTGSKATSQLAKMYQDDIMNNWGVMTTYNYKDITYNLVWDVNVRVAAKGEVENFNGVNNYMEVTSEYSYVSGTNKGKIRNKSHIGIPFELDNPMSHEFGHILGLKDKYQKVGNNKNEPISEEWIGNIMAEEAGVGLATKKNLDILLPKAIDSYSYFKQTNSFIPWVEFMNKYYFINQNNRE